MSGLWGPQSALDLYLQEQGISTLLFAGVNADQVNAAQGFLADMCGGGYFFAARSIARVSGDTVAYGCNYGGGQTCHSGDVWGFFGQINDKCGFAHGASAGAGWYSKNSWKATYGRGSVGAGYC